METKSFRAFWLPLPKSEKRKILASLSANTEFSENTIRAWFLETRRPMGLARSIAANYIKEHYNTILI